MKEIQADMRLRRVSTDRFSAHVHPGWNISSNPNGGFLLSMVMESMLECSTHHDPLSVTTHFLRPGIAGADCEIQVDLLREGRTLSTVRGRLLQDDRVRLEVLAGLGNLGEPAGIEEEIAIPPAVVPDVEHCVPRSGELQDIELPFAEKVDVRLHPDQLPGSSQRAEVSGWVRLADGSVPDPTGLLLFADAFPPAVFTRLGKVGWVPTIELTVHVRKRPTPGWIRAQFNCEDLSGGRMIETGCLWDSSGQLVAQSRQLGLVMKAD